MTEFVTKRIYEPADPQDGYRVLVDRLWPRGVSKERAKLDEWAKDLAPSTELRKWFSHDSDKFAEFTEKYMKELKNGENTGRIVDAWLRYPKVTILYGARDQKYNEAEVLRNWLGSHR